LTDESRRATGTRLRKTAARPYPASWFERRKLCFRLRTTSHRMAAHLRTPVLFADVQFQTRANSIRIDGISIRIVRLSFLVALKSSYPAPKSDFGCHIVLLASAACALDLQVAFCATTRFHAVARKRFARSLIKVSKPGTLRQRESHSARV